MKNANVYKSLIGGLLFSVAAAPVYSQSFEPIDGGFDIENAVSLPPPPTVATGSTSNTQLGPAVTHGKASDLAPVNQTADTTPTAAPEVTPVGGFDKVDFSTAMAGQPLGADSEMQLRQLEMQEQQLKRIERVEEGLNKLVKKQSFSKSIMGTIISAATTADPVLAAIGGIAGFLIGKAEDYKQAEEKNYELQQDIIRESPGYYTDEELKLAAYADLDLDPNLLSVAQIKIYANYVVEARTRKRTDSWYGPGPSFPGSSEQPGYMIASRQGQLTSRFVPVGATVDAAQLPSANYADLCYGHLRASRTQDDAGEGLTNASVVTRRGENQALSPLDRRNLSRYCFYSLR